MKSVAGNLTSCRRRDWCPTAESGGRDPLAGPAGLSGRGMVAGTRPPATGRTVHQPLPARHLSHSPSQGHIALERLACVVGPVAGSSNDDLPMLVSGSGEAGRHHRVSFAGKEAFGDSPGSDGSAVSARGRGRHSVLNEWQLLCGGQCLSNHSMRPPWGAVRATGFPSWARTSCADPAPWCGS
jgi:hypothetical protein